MALFDNRNDGFDIERELAALRRDITALGDRVSRRGAAAYHGAGDDLGRLYDEIATGLSAAMPALKRRARGVEETIRDNPGRVVATAGLAVLAVAAVALFAGRRR